MSRLLQWESEKHEGLLRGLRDSPMEHRGRGAGTPAGIQGNKQAIETYVGASTYVLQDPFLTQSALRRPIITPHSHVFTGLRCLRLLEA